MKNITITKTYECPQVQTYAVQSEGLLCNSNDNVDPLKGWFDELEF